MHIPRMQILTMQKKPSMQMGIYLHEWQTSSGDVKSFPLICALFLPNLPEMATYLKFRSTLNTFKLSDDSYIYNRRNTCKGVTYWYCDQKSFDY